jgi:hypothetical protein
LTAQLVSGAEYGPAFPRLENLQEVFSYMTAQQSKLDSNCKKQNPHQFSLMGVGLDK